jgi:hypothetical protein
MKMDKAQLKFRVSDCDSVSVTPKKTQNDTYS